MGAVALFACALGYGWSTFHRYAGGLPPKPFNPLPSPAAAVAAGGGAPAAAAAMPAHLAELLRSTVPTVEERRTIMNDMMGKVAASPEQRKKIEDIWITGFKNPDTLMDRVGESTKVLTPEQLQKLQPYFVAVVTSRVARLSKVMNARDFITLNQRLVTALAPRPATPAAPPIPAGRK